MYRYTENDAADAGAGDNAMPPAPAASSDPLGPAVAEGDARATSELERVFRKEDFKKMRIVGQFNLVGAVQAEVSFHIALKPADP